MTRKEAILGFARSFMMFCLDEKISTIDAGRFVRLRDSIGSLTLRGTGGLTPRSRKRLGTMQFNLERLAAEYKLKVDFGNPYPALKRGTQYVEIPILP